MMPNLMNYKEKMRKLLLRRDFTTASELSSKTLASCITINDEFNIVDRVDSTHLRNFILKLEVMTNGNISSSMVSAKAIECVTMESFIKQVRAISYDKNFLATVLMLQIKYINHGYKFSFSNLPTSRGILKSLVDNVKYSVAKSLYESKDDIQTSVNLMVQLLDNLLSIFKYNNIEEELMKINPECLLPNLTKLSDEEFENFLSSLARCKELLVVAQNDMLQCLIDSLEHYIQSFDLDLNLN